MRSTPTIAAAGLALATLFSHAPARANTPSLALPFIDDDYPRAVALAKQRKVPIFVESWAPW